MRIWEDVVRMALREDLGSGDVTTLNVVPEQARATGLFFAKFTGVVAGLPIVREVFRQIDDSLDFVELIAEGSPVKYGDHIAKISGSAQSILMGERVALNFLQRMSGVATLTSQFVKAVEGTSTRIVDTRKTTPGLRLLEKYAVRIGGGHNHRMNLSDAVMIKDNHIIAAGGITPAVQRARAAIPHTMTITVECETLEQVAEALDAGADILLLDNMDFATRSAAVNLAKGRAKTEASGGIDLETVAEAAATGVDIISVGALTHSAPALDISLDLEIG